MELNCPQTQTFIVLVNTIKKTDDIAEAPFAPKKMPIWASKLHPFAPWLVLSPQVKQKVKFLLLSSWLSCNIWSVSNLDVVNSLYLQNGIQKYKNRRMRRIKLRIVMTVKWLWSIGRMSSIRGRLCPERWRKYGLLCNIIVFKLVSKLGTSCIHGSFWHYSLYKSVLYFFMRYERKSKYHDKPFSNGILSIFIIIAKSQRLYLPPPRLTKVETTTF
jgi:hypothetical protein